MKFPTNPAYFSARKKSEADAFSAGQTLLDYCRVHNMPFNEADSILYKMQQSKDQSKLFNVYLDSMVETRRPWQHYSDVKNLSSLNQVGGTFMNGMPPACVLPSGKVHLGWPRRLDTAERMVGKLREVT